MANSKQNNKFHTIEISIPRNMVFETNGGLLKLVPSLTKKGNITKRAKQPSIILEENDSNVPRIVRSGSLGFTDAAIERINKARQQDLKKWKAQQKQLDKKPTKKKK